MIRFITTFGYVGLLRPAPGTWGSAIAIPFAWLVHGLFGFPGVLVATVAVTWLGVWSIDRAIAAGAPTDPPEIVIDEVAGQFIALWPLSAGMWIVSSDPWSFPWPGWVAAFLLFRLFDIWKPGPIGAAEKLPGGRGVMADDVLAGATAAVIVTIAAWIFHRAIGV